MSEEQCGLGSYYDGLVEECKKCYLRCNSPPRVCTQYCGQPSEIKSPETNTVRLNLVWLGLFVTLCAFSTLLLLLRVLRKKASESLRKDKRVMKPNELIETAEAGQPSRTAEEFEDTQLENVTIETMDLDGQTQWHSKLPVPSTEEGTPILVTAKTGQRYNLTDLPTEGKTLGWLGKGSFT
ncbi:tumor necrosis factor receptor superfamily member 17 [Aplochiton taeniatus]